MACDARAPDAKSLAMWVERGGGFQTWGVFPTWARPSQFVKVSFWGFIRFLRIFPNFSGIFKTCSFRLSRPVEAPTRNSPERVSERSGPSPEKVGNLAVWKPPGLASFKLRVPIGCTHRARTTPHPPKKGFEKVLGRVVEKGSQKSSYKSACYGCYSRGGFWRRVFREGGCQKVPRTLKT